MLYLINFARSVRIGEPPLRPAWNTAGGSFLAGRISWQESLGQPSNGAQVACVRVLWDARAASRANGREQCALLMLANDITALCLYQCADERQCGRFGLARNLIISVINLAKSAPFVTCSAPFESRNDADADADADQRKGAVGQVSSECWGDAHADPVQASRAFQWAAQRKSDNAERKIIRRLERIRSAADKADGLGQS